MSQGERSCINYGKCGLEGKCNTRCFGYKWDEKTEKDTEPKKKGKKK